MEGRKMNPHEYYPGVLITNHDPDKIKVKKFFDPKVRLWKVVIKFHHGGKNGNNKENNS